MAYAHCNQQPFKDAPKPKHHQAHTELVRCLQCAAHAVIGLPSWVLSVIYLCSCLLCRVVI